MNLRGRNKVSPEFSMSSMTDIVFLLLVFFMLTSNAPNALDMILPKAKGKSTNTKNVAVSIKKNQNYYINNKNITASKIEVELRAPVLKSEYILTNMVGKTLASGQLKLGKSVINTSKLPNGIYVINIRNSKSSKAYKLVKN